MALSDCAKCWDTPCTCGWDYRNWSKEARIALAAVVLGVDRQEIELLEIPTLHPKSSSSDFSEKTDV